MYAFQQQKNSANLPVLVDTSNVYSAFDNPKEIGYFSINSSKQIQFDRSEMKYYIPISSSKLPLDLSAGYDYTIRKEFDRAARMEQLLRWILHNGSDIVDKSSRGPGEVDFVTLRGTLQKLFCSPFGGSKWTICATKFKGTIYFVENDKEAARLRKITETARERLMSSWGYKFEQYLTAATPHGIPNMSSVTHEVEEFSAVIRNRLKNHVLIYKAEVDGVKNAEAFKVGTGDPSCYVEMKTSKISPTFRYDYVFQKFKSLQWWAQSYVVGIKEIICGMRDDLGMVRSIETFNIDQLPSMCVNFWTPNPCFNFCDRFLTFLKEHVVEDDHRVVYKLDFTAGSPVSCQKLSFPGDFLVVPDWYAAELNRR